VTMRVLGLPPMGEAPTGMLDSWFSVFSAIPSLS